MQALVRSRWYAAYVIFQCAGVCVGLIAWTVLGAHRPLLLAAIALELTAFALFCLGVYRRRSEVFTSNPERDEAEAARYYSEHPLSADAGNDVATRTEHAHSETSAHS